MGTRLLILGVAFLGIACPGPRPETIEAELIAPSKAGEPYRIEAIVRNAGRGEGQVELILLLRDRKTGRTVRAEKKVHLEGREEVVIIEEIEAPPGDYEVQVESQYPPR